MTFSPRSPRVARWCALAASVTTVLASSSRVVAAPGDEGAASGDLPLAFPNLGPDGLASRVGGQFALERLTGINDSVIRFELFGEYMTARGLGGYAQAAASVFESNDALGDVELGGLRRGQLAGLGAPEVTWRLGVVVPTVSDAPEKRALAAVSVTALRPADRITGNAGQVGLRCAAAPTWRRGQVVYRGDVGLDVGASTDTFGAYLHVGAGVGYTTAWYGVTAELSTTLAITGDGFDGQHLMAISVQARGGPATPYLALSLPLTRIDAYDVTPASNVIAGVRIGL